MPNASAGEVAVFVGSSSTANARLPPNSVYAQNGSGSVAREGLADDRNRRARHAIERGAVVGQREAQVGVRVDRHRRPAVRPHRQRFVRARGRAHVLRGAVRCRRSRAPRGPTRRRAPSRAPTWHALRAAARAIGRACGGGARHRTRRRASRGGRRSSSARRTCRPPSIPGHATSNGMWPSGS